MVSIIETETETEEDIFGYSYFNKDLNFFDNFPTQSRLYVGSWR